VQQALPNRVRPAVTARTALAGRRTAAAAGGVLALAGVFGTRLWPVGYEERMVVKAYEDRRLTPARLPGARFVQQDRAERAASGDTLSLIEARAVVLRGLARNPQDLRWTRMGAQIDVLGQSYDKAVQTLVERQEFQGVLGDLGVAYLARGFALGDPADYENAIEYLSRALRENPSDRVARYNRALALEAYFLWNRAEEDWNAYLAVDGTSGWAGEAREHLDRLRERRASWRRKLDQIRAEGDALPSRLEKPPGLAAEPLLDQALTTWLPAAAEAALDGSARRALTMLASLLVQEHQDFLLTDVLGGPRGSRFAAGARRLAEAIRQNNRGEQESGYREARQAADAFREAGSEAAALRADEEAVYALSRTYRTEECLEQSGALLARVEQFRYPWVRVQGLLARATCLERLGDMGISGSLKEQAKQLATRHRYEILGLRVDGLTATSSTLVGDFAKARKQDFAGLGRFWEGVYPAMRGYQFYSDLTEAAEKSGSWQTAYLLAREAVEMVELTGNRRTEGMAHFRLAMCASLAGLSERSSEEQHRASDILTQLEGESTKPAFRAEQLIGIAEAHLENGKTDLAREALGLVNKESIEPSILLKLGFHVAAGTVLLRDGKLKEARTEFENAHELMRASLPSVPTGRERANWQRAKGRIFRSLTHLLIEADKDPDAALALWTEYRSVPIRAANALPNTAGIRRDAARLHDASVLSFVQFEDRIAGWFYDDRGIYPFSSPFGRKEAARACSEFRKLTSDRNSKVEDVRRKGQVLYSALIGPAAGLLDNRRVLALEPDGPCAGIAFEALADGNGAPLGERLAIVTWPGASERLTMPPSRWVGGDLHALIVSDPRLEGEMAAAYPALPDARREGASVAGWFPRHTLLTGAAATLDAVRRSMETADVFHFAGHGLATSEDGTLLLTPQGESAGAALLRSAEVEDVARRCRMVVLSACSTGAGEKLGGFNPESLVQAFWRAGMPTVVATRWAVDSRAALRLMDSFYRGLASGQSPAQALRSASQLLRGDPAFAHPAYWAAFHVFGSPISNAQEYRHARK
jgi:CHAT domain-containing protein